MRRHWSGSPAVGAAAARAAAHPGRWYGGHRRTLACWRPWAGTGTGTATSMHSHGRAWGWTGPACRWWAASAGRPAPWSLPPRSATAARSWDSRRVILDHMISYNRNLRNWYLFMHWWRSVFLGWAAAGAAWPLVKQLRIEEAPLWQNSTVCMYGLWKSGGWKLNGSEELWCLDFAMLYQFIYAWW